MPPPLRNSDNFFLTSCVALGMLSTTAGYGEPELTVSPAVAVHYQTESGKYYQLQVKEGAGWRDVGFAIEGTGEVYEEYYPTGEYRLISPRQEWVKVWADEFEGDDLDYRKWEKEENNYGGGNNERQAYRTDPKYCFVKGQVGSSAMPHKMNSRSCERINGFKTILGGHLTMASSLAGDQWNEGDVSCSVVRRVMLPDAFFAVDGLLETMVTILDQMDAYSAVIERENDHYLPFLLSTTIMMTAVKRGVGRETAHEVIKEHAVAAAQAYRTGESDRNDLVNRLAEDGRLEMTADELTACLEEGKANAGAVQTQIDRFISEASTYADNIDGAGDYSPGAIL